MRIAEKCWGLYTLDRCQRLLLGGARLVQNFDNLSVLASAPGGCCSRSGTAELDGATTFPGVEVATASVGSECAEASMMLSGRRILYQRKKIVSEYVKFVRKRIKVANAECRERDGFEIMNIKLKSYLCCRLRYSQQCGRGTLGTMIV